MKQNRIENLNQRKNSNDIGNEYFASNITLTNPSFTPAALAFPEAENGNLPTLISYPASFAAFSV